jgi:hypothetical protein
MITHIYSFVEQLPSTFKDNTIVYENTNLFKEFQIYICSVYQKIVTSQIFVNICDVSNIYQYLKGVNVRNLVRPFHSFQNYKV